MVLGCLQKEREYQSRDGYKNTMLDTVHGLRYFICPARRFGKWLYFRIQVSVCHYRQIYHFTSMLVATL
jgi:hypothetical protein